MKTSTYTYMTLVLLVALGGCSDSGDSDAGSSETSVSYTIVDEQQTGLGTEAVVAVVENGDPEKIFNQVLDEHDDFVSVTIVCAGQEDVDQYGYILYGVDDEGSREVKGGEQDRTC